MVFKFKIIFIAKCIGCDYIAISIPEFANIPLIIVRFYLLIGKTNDYSHPGIPERLKHLFVYYWLVCPYVFCAHLQHQRNILAIPLLKVMVAVRRPYHASKVMREVIAEDLVTIDCIFCFLWRL